MSLTINQARPADYAAAFRLAFRHLDKADQEHRVNVALDLIQKKELDPAGLWVAREDDVIMGSLLCQPMPGAAGLVWPPQIVDAERRIIEDLLIQHACAWLRRQGARLAQALMPVEEAHLALALERHGFEHITALSYLRGWLERAPADEPKGLTFIPYDADPRRFEATQQLTYEGTQDCPELTGVRTIEEIMEGHRAQGLSNRWWLAEEAGQAVGVLFLVDAAELKSVDVSYVGVTPRARSRGLGRQLLLKAIAEARQAGAKQITVSVDARNQPAIKLYQSMGFEPYDSREVFLAVWERAQAAS
jgi:ribosomal protein S18 acetylase RimI-like enzyme